MQPLSMGRKSTDKLYDGAERPEWDTTPIRMRGWLNLLPEYLESIDPNYGQWWSGAALSECQSKWRGLWYVA